MAGEQEEQNTSPVDQVRAAARAFAAAAEALDSEAYETEVQELRKKDVAALVDDLDAVRAWLADLLGVAGEQVAQFLGDAAGREFEAAAAHLAASGEKFFALVNKLDPGEKRRMDVIRDRIRKP